MIIIVKLIQKQQVKYKLVLFYNKSNKMNKKLECIKNLKSKLHEMQRQLQMMQVKNNNKRQNQSEQKSMFNKTVTLSNYSSRGSPIPMTKSPSWKNPNYWGSNPITGKQNYVLSPSKWKKDVSPRSIKKQMSPQLSHLKKFVDQQYYDHSKVEPRSVNQSILNKYQSTKSQRYLYSFHGLQRDTPRFEKIKTYEQPPKNPILNPEKEEERGKKIVKKPSLSPSINLIENPKSNPQIYCFGSKVSILSPKSNNRKNMSPSVKQVLSTSLEQKVTSPNRKSCKKHFARYFRETYESKWN